MQEARDARESTVGSFDVLIARTGHRTNDIMKILTLTSVILLPGALIAGVMGMNFKVEIFEATWLFYVVLALILAIAFVTAGVAKFRGWDLIAAALLGRRARSAFIGPSLRSLQCPGVVGAVGGRTPPTAPAKRC